MKNNKLHQLIFFVTSRCNSRCRHCFNWKNLNKEDDLNINDIEEITKKMPKIENLLISGGEPFLRADLPEIIKIFSKNNKIKTVSIPSNGLLTNTIVDSLEKILAIDNIESINLNISLDGFKEVHDKIRGVENNFKISLETLKKVSQLKADNKKLNILINSVITQENKESLLELNDFISAQKKSDGHFFEIIRPLGPEQFKKLDISFDYYKKLISRQYKYFKEKNKDKNIFKRIAKNIVFLGRLVFFYKIQYKNYFKNKNWPMPCTAGENIVVLNDKGWLSVCELRSKTFNLKNHQSFNELKQSQEYKKELADIKKEKCFCTHVCFIDSSINKNIFKKNIYFFFQGIINYLRYETINYNS